MVCFHVIGNDTHVAWAASRGQLELNVMMPIIAHDGARVADDPDQRLPQLSRESRARHRGRRGAAARPAGTLVGAMATPLAPYIGYALAADIAKEAVRTGRTIRELVIEKGVFTADQTWTRFSTPHELTEPGVAGGFRFTPKMPEGYKPPTGPVGAGG